jgi:hypothetical protein
MGIQNVSVSCRTLSVVLCIVFLLFQVRRKESTKKKKGEMAFQLADRQLLMVLVPGLP